MYNIHLPYNPDNKDLLDESIKNVKEGDRPRIRAFEVGDGDLQAISHGYVLAAMADLGITPTFKIIEQGDHLFNEEDLVEFDEYWKV